MKILNLYAGIGGNRKLWGDEHEITAVEHNPKIAKIYQDFFPNDKVIVGDAHQYLLDHYEEFDFIWSSPPCPTHSRMNLLSNVQEGKSVKYPEMTLYQEILYLKHWFKGKWCVENVISYYDPLIPPNKLAGHYFWTNFILRDFVGEDRGILTSSKRKATLDDRIDKIGLDIKKFNLTKTFTKKVINNCAEPEVGKHILDLAINPIDLQRTIF